MKTRFVATATALAIAAVSAAPANAATAIKSLVISNAAGTWLQVPEIQAFNSLGANVALTGTASAANAGTWNAGSIAASANDGITVAQQTFDFAADGVTTFTMYHPAVIAANDALTITFNAVYDISSLTLFGRTDVSGDPARNVYNYSLLDINGGVVASGTLDTNNMAAVATAAVPEPATWAMMMVGFGVLGFGLRRRSTTSRVSFKFA